MMGCWRRGFGRWRRRCGRSGRSSWRRRIGSGARLRIRSRSIGRSGSTSSKQGVFSIDGTPVDCVYLALLHLVPRRPALVVSGINNGFNLGSDVFYSGTVAGAVEGALRGVPALAVSLERRQPPGLLARGGVRSARWRPRSSGAAPRPCRMRLCSASTFRPGPCAGYRVTFLGRRVYRDQVDVRQDLRGRSYYWIGGPEESATDLPGLGPVARYVRRWPRVTPLESRPHPCPAHRRAGQLAGWEFRARGDRAR